MNKPKSPEDFCMNLSDLTSEGLLNQTQEVVASERRATIAVLRHLREIERRRLYAERGYSSIFEMATKYFGFSEGEAYRRVAAMRLVHEAPELEAKIESGSLSLTVAAQVRTFCKKNKKDVRMVVAIVDGKSSRESERELLKLVPELIPQERVRALTEEHTAITLILDRELMARLDKLLALRSHVEPNMNYRELIAQLAELGEKSWDPTQRKTTSAQKSERALRSAAFSAANGQCTFVDSFTGRRCGARHFLEVDHIIPRSLGGRNELENLRVLCREHNQLAAIEKLGAHVMAPYLA